ncbi:MULTISPECIES: carbon-nitrogen hydrolase family protein [Paracoccus]|uniref:carbon-nitrogen hydrolase family protein n=1 Tax=Paracoccus TaxID=265 RepID=UPI000869F49C|nr:MULTISPECIES: carbon-nitrogen hydrolase family protein [Paracoccus]ODT59824.1 MAG: amidohydrolase [Paracoccus sp. SCN 68-21]
MKIAAAAYPIDWFDTFNAYAAKLTRWVAEAQADLLVFPEYGAMELASLGGAAVAGDLEASLHEVARHWPAVHALHADLATRHGCHILGASGPVFDGARPVNRAVLYGPGGVIGHQDKQIMTRFEREDWDVIGAPGLRVFDTALGRIGVLICYDSEFPLLGRILAEAGAEILLVPSCTDTVAGFTRVRIGAMARALESQCVVVQAPTVGPCDWMPALDENRGRAAIYGPPDGFWPETGIIAEGAMDAPGWVRAQIDLSRVRTSRAEGAVLPFAHWPEQDRSRLIR